MELAREIMFFIIVIVLAFAFLRVFGLYSRVLHMTAKAQAEGFIMALAEDAVRAVEEEAAAMPEDKRPKGDEKRKLAFGLISRGLQEHGLEVPPDLLVGKIDAAVQRMR